MFREIKNNLKNVDVVFFDVFDTILLRNIEPEYVKKIWSMFIINIFQLNLNPIDLYNKRNEIETFLCDNSVKIGLDPEFRYKEMIMLIYDFIIIDNKINVDCVNFYKKCIEIELGIEKRVQYVDYEVLDLIKYIKRKNKKIICISDMYFNKKTIQKMFSNLKIDQLIDDIFVSEKNLISKKSGRLYKKILKKIALNPKKCIMIGDNQSSDYDIPNSLGINSYLIDRNHQKEIYSNFSNENNEKLLVQELSKILNKKNNQPFVDIVYSLYLYTEKLYFKLIELGVDDVVFFSREGEFMKKLFDEYQKTVFSKKINSHYLLVSRKSTYLPSLNKLDKEKFEVLFRAYNNISPEEFLTSLNFNEKEIIKVHVSLGEKNKFRDKITNFSKSKEYKLILKDKVFRSLYRKKRLDQKELFRKYINQLNLQDKRNIHIVDVGWKGTIQSNIQRILEKCTLSGHYLGLSVYEARDMDNKEGLLFSNYPNVSENFKLFNENKPMFEILLGASHGGAAYYYEEDGVVKVKTHNIKKEIELFNKVINPIQKDIISKFCLIKDLIQNRLYDTKKIERLFNKKHFDMVFSPSAQELNFFSGLYHFENFGLFSFTKFNSSIKLSLNQKIREYLKYFLRHEKYVSDYYWCQLKNYNNRLKLLMKIYALERYIYFKNKNII